jgi:hypothetical protein
LLPLLALPPAFAVAHGVDVKVRTAVAVLLLLMMLDVAVAAGAEDAIARGAGDTRSLEKRAFRLKGPMVCGSALCGWDQWPVPTSRIVAGGAEGCRDWK